MKISFTELINCQPPEYEQEIILSETSFDKTIVVLDDDPTGCQTLNDVPVLFSFEKNLLTTILKEKPRLFFILTNTRSMPEHDAVLVISEVMKNLASAAGEAERDFIVVSRSDSTLRGHYPAELQAIEKFLPGNYIHCLVPAFFPGGRYTCDDIHYVREGQTLIPSGDTPFAADSVFGYRNSDLKDYVAEKTKGTIRSDQVLSISIADIRNGGPETVSDLLCNSDHPVCIVNALTQSDLDVFAAGVWDAIYKGKLMLFRTGASFLNSFSGIKLREPMKGSDLRSGSSKGGLIVAGSYVPKTSAQLLPLFEIPGIIPIELNVSEILTDAYNEIISSVSAKTEHLINNGSDVLIYTSRELIHSDQKSKDLEIGKVVSEALAQIVSGIKTMPSFIVAKGGITSHVIASSGFKIRSAKVIGQALPGVSVLVPDDRPGMKYIIFPGNVGDENALVELYKLLTNK